MTTDTEFPLIGWLDPQGNILEEDDAQAVVDALNSGLDPIADDPYTITNLFVKVETEDFWQADLDEGDPGPQPKHRVL